MTTRPPACVHLAQGWWNGLSYSAGAGSRARGTRTRLLQREEGRRLETPSHGGLVRRMPCFRQGLDFPGGLVMFALTLTMACLLAVASMAEEKSIHPARVYETVPSLREIMSDVVFWANFEESPEPVMGESYASADEAVKGEFGSAPGLVGRALLCQERNYCCYPAQGNWDLSKPGGLSFWVCPLKWDRSEASGIRNAFFRSNFSRKGYLGINRMAKKIVKRRFVEPDQIYFYAHHFPDTKNTNLKIGDSLGPDWADRTWHLFVVNWKGAHFEVSMDGAGLKSASLSCRTSAGDVKELIIGGSKEPTLIDEFMIYRRPLTEVDVRMIMDALYPKRLHLKPRDAAAD